MAEDSQQREPFVPRGAMMFFAVMLAVYAAAWAGMYLLLVARSG